MNNNICKSFFVTVALVIGILSSHVSASDNFSTSYSTSDDSLGIVITQNSSYLMPGQELEINVFTTCKSKHEISDVNIGGATVPLRENGIASFKVAAGSLGFHEIPIVISFKGIVPYKNCSVKYEVGQANGCIALDKMNVLYAGIDNIVWIATSVASDEKVKVFIKGGGGSIKRLGSGKYNVHVTSVTDDCRIYLDVDGKLIMSSLFKVRNLPVPNGSVGGYTSGDSVLLKAFSNQVGVLAFLKDFPFELSYKITGYNLSIQNDKGQIKSVNCQGAAFSSEAKQLMTTYLRPGCSVTIGNLFASPPEGRKLKLLPLVYYIK